MNFTDVKALSSLLNECEKASAPQETLPNRSLQNTKVVLPSDIDSKKNNDDSKMIWNESELPTEDGLVDLDDKRPVAKYEIYFKHDNISTEDTFLGMNGKSSASSDSTHIVVKVYFPKSRMEDIDLDCTKNRVRASSKYHRMFTYLPRPVNHLKGTAKFDTKTSILSVTLPILDDE